MKQTRLLLITAACSLLAACGHQVPTGATTHQDIWQLRGVSSYDFVYHEGGMAGTCALLVHVRRNRVASAVTRHRCAWLDTKDALTIDGVFSKLRSAFRHSDKVTATYDPRYGYPTAVSVDQDRNAIDDEWGFGISDFEPK